MGKNTKKGVAGRKPKQTFVSLSLSALRGKIKTKIITKADRVQKPQIHLPRISKLLNEEILSCSICLQLLLSPVLAQCGHTFCLYCSEDLAKNGFACGICHTHLPTYDLQHSRIIEKLVNEYLDNQESEERENYFKRTWDMQRKQENRRIKDIQEGAPVDFWCEDELVWKSGRVTQKMKNGDLIVTPTHHPKEVVIHIESRKLAPPRTFTKDPPIPDPPQFPFRAMNLQANNPFEPLRMRMNERPYIFGMPMFLGYYWREGSFRPGGVEEMQEDNHQFTF